VLQDDGYSMTMAFSETKERELDLLERGRQRRLAGILMTTSGEDDDELIAARDRFGAPIVFLESEVPGDWTMVNIAHDMATRAAIDQLVGLGHRRIALVASDTRSAVTRKRISGFRTALDRRGLKCPASLIRNGARGADAGFAEIRQRQFSRADLMCCREFCGRADRTASAYQTTCR
jgi:DNA-binding LacI/PurR family transcriptional regulator